MKKLKMLVMLAIAGQLVAATAQAAFISGVSIEGYSAQQNGGSFAANNIVNGNGFNATAGTHTDAWDPNNWQTGAPVTIADQWITFDLGDEYNLASVSIWNFNRNGFTNLGIETMDILVSSDNSTWENLGEFTLTEASGVSTYAGETHSLSAANKNIRYVKFDVSTIFNDSPGGPQVGLSEVRFTPVYISGVSIEGYSAQQNGGSFAANNIVNGNGFNATAGTHTDAWDPNNWQTGAPVTIADQWITFDLGDEYNLASVSIWNFNRNGFTNLGIETMDILVSSDNSTWENLGEFTLTEASGVSTYAGETHSLSAANKNIRYVKFDVSTIFNDSPGGPQVGLSEVRFAGAASPPRGTVIVIR